MPDSILGASDLGHAYGSVVALHGVDLDVPSGRIGLVGANGAGKTTLIKILLGILSPTVGTTSVLGRSSQEETIEVRSHVGYMPEGDCLPVDQKASDFLVLAAGLAGLPSQAARQRASDVLTLVGLDEERFRYLGDYSTGMKQRTKLAQAIVHDPSIVFLDEPAAGLDPQGREEMLELIARLGSFGINVLVSSHVLADIERTCDWVVMLDGGRVLRSGPLETLVDASMVDVEVLGDPTALVRWLEAAGATVEKGDGKITVSRAEEVYELVRDGLAATGTGLRSLGPRSTSLEDVFLEAGEAR